MTSLLSIKNLKVSVNGKEIIRNLNLEVNAGEIVAIMGPNGSGKSTLALALAGDPKYKITNRLAKIEINSEEITFLSPDERAKRGLFLAFQQPVAVPGVTINSFLRLAQNTIFNYQTENSPHAIKTKCPTGTWLKQNHRHYNIIPVAQFLQDLKNQAKTLNLSEDFLKRHLNDGLSGGEKKKTEALQALILKPKVAIFDEIDTGLDIDSLKTVALAIAKLAREKTGIILITHYQRLLKYLSPHKVCILINGKIVKEGSASLVPMLEEKGYAPFLN